MVKKVTCIKIKQRLTIKSKNNKSWYNFCLGSVSKNFTKDEQNEISLNGIVYDFSVDHSSIKKQEILNFDQYLMVKNNIK